MIGFKENVPLIIQTQRGDIPINETYIGDVVYDYRTGEELEIQGIVNSPIEDIYQIEYTDGRQSYYRSSELVYTGDRVHTIENIINNIKYLYTGTSHLKIIMDQLDIRQYPINYNQKRIVNPVFPDPYITGALITYGKYDDPYINLPLDRRTADQLFSHKYQLDFGDKLGNNTVYFSYNGNPRDKLITWKEFFYNYNFYIPSDEILSMGIPKEYMRASINNRWQYIRGVFDVGYDVNMFPDNCGIAHVMEAPLISIQKMLWSLGILSTVTYDPYLPKSKGMKYRLDVLGCYDGYPGMFYSGDFIEKILGNDNRLIRQAPIFKVQIKSIRYITRGYSTNIVLNNPNMIYLTGDFLPRVSL